MPYPYDILDSGVVYLHAREPFAIDELILTVETIFADSRFRPGMPALFDLSQVNLVGIRKVDIDVYVDWIGQNIERRGRNSRSAVVVSSETAFGVLRMYQAYAEHIPVTIRVFRSIAEAENWIFEGSRHTPAR